MFFVIDSGKAVLWFGGGFVFAESTRKLYEKKLNDAMTKKTKPSSSNKTYYREERKTSLEKKKETGFDIPHI